MTDSPPAAPPRAVHRSRPQRLAAPPAQAAGPTDRLASSDRPASPDQPASPAPDQPMRPPGAADRCAQRPGAKAGRHSAQRRRRGGGARSRSRASRPASGGRHGKAKPNWLDSPAYRSPVPSDLADALRRAHGVDVSDVLVSRGPLAGQRARELGAQAFTRQGEVVLPLEAEAGQATADQGSARA